MYNIIEETHKSQIGMNGKCVKQFSLPFQAKNVSLLQFLDMILLI